MAKQSDSGLKVLAAGIPSYSSEKMFIQILNGVSGSLCQKLINDLWSQRGTPQETVDWTNPEDWIPNRLEGQAQDLAFRIWRESNGQINPRYLYSVDRFAQKYNLLAEDEDDILRITDSGKKFLKNHHDLIVSIDDSETLLTVLQIVAERGPARRAEFFEDYAAYCRTQTTYRSDSVIYGALYDRLSNLMDRGYVNRQGWTYEITQQGLEYLKSVDSNKPGADLQSNLLGTIKTLNQDARSQLANHLSQINPFQFEKLIALLLERMGYDGVETTSPTNDKGVDVVADITLGISQVREVVQAKRYKGTVGRPVLDGLRGSLHRFKAVRGTIITTGKFSKDAQNAAFESGAAPITLIDGERLLDLLSEYQIGIKRKTVEYLEFDPKELAQFSEESGEETN